MVTQLDFEAIKVTVAVDSQRCELENPATDSFFPTFAKLGKTQTGVCYPYDRTLDTNKSCGWTQSRTYQRYGGTVPTG